MTAVRVRSIFMLSVALTCFESSGAIFTHHDRVLNSIRGQAMAFCGSLLAEPLSTKNWSRPTTLKNGERMIARGLVDMAESWVAALVAQDRPALDHLVEFSYLYSKADISQESYDLFTRLNIIDSAGFKFPDYPATVRSIVRTKADGSTYFTSPLPLSTLPDWKLRRYLDQIEKNVIRPIAARATELGIGGEAATDVPHLKGPRTPIDGSLLIDLGDDFAPITLITPFGRVSILTASKLGNDDEWKQLKAYVADSMGLVPADLPEGVEGEHGRILAAVTDFTGDRFSFPDKVIATDTVADDEMQAKWNALHPERRDVFRIRPK